MKTKKNNSQSNFYLKLDNKKLPFGIYKSPDNYYRFVNHAEGLVTTGFPHENKLLEYKDIIRFDKATIKTMKARYNEFFGGVTDVILGDEKQAQPKVKHTEGEAYIGKFFTMVKGQTINVGPEGSSTVAFAAFPTMYDEGEANAAELVKRWNAYPELVEALKKANELLKKRCLDTDIMMNELKLDSLIKKV